MKRLVSFAMVCWAGIGVLFAQQVNQQSLLTGEEIRGIDVTGRWDIVITQGDQTGVKLEYDSALTEKYNVTCELDGTTVYLNVENKDGSPNIEGPVMAYAYVTLSSLDKFRVFRGACKITAKDTLTANHCDINIVGVGDIENVSLKVQTLSYEQTGAAQISGLNIKAQEDVDIAIAGVGNCSDISIRTAGDLQIKTKGVVRFAADIDVNKVTVEASSNMGKICLRGHAARKTVHSSPVKQIDLSQLEVSDAQ